MAGTRHPVRTCLRLQARLLDPLSIGISMENDGNGESENSDQAALDARAGSGLI